MSLGEGIGPFLFDRVLSGEDEEGLLQREGFSDHRDAMFLHRFQHGGLRLGGRAIDLVGQDDVGKKRPLHELELAPAGFVLLDDVGARNVHRHQVGRELDAAETEVHGLGEPAHQERLGQTGDAHQQGMSLREEADRKLLDDRLLADDDLGQFIAHEFVVLAQFLDGADVVGVEFRFQGGSHEADSFNLAAPFPFGEKVGIWCVETREGPYSMSPRGKRKFGKKSIFEKLFRIRVFHAEVECHEKNLPLCIAAGFPRWLLSSCRMDRAEPGSASR